MARLLTWQVQSRCEDPAMNISSMLRVFFFYFSNLILCAELLYTGLILNLSYVAVMRKFVLSKSSIYDWFVYHRKKPPPLQHPP